MNDNMLIDIGANIGDYTYAFMQKKELALERFIIVEPNPSLIIQLKERFKNNPTVTIINKAASNEKNHIEFFISNISTISTADRNFIEKSRFATRLGGPYQWNQKILVETIGVDDLISIHGVPRFLKIDVEGYEYNVIKSITKKYDCEWVGFEWHEEFVEDAIRCVTHLYDLGWKKFGFTDMGEGHDTGYDLFPKETMDFDVVINKLKSYDPSRSTMWGMIFSY